MIKLPNSKYVELYSEMAAAILIEHQGDLIELYQTEQNGDIRYTDEAQELFNEYCDFVEGVLEHVGIGQDYNLEANTNG